MKLLSIGAVALFASVTTAKPFPPDPVAPLAAKGMENLKKFVAKNPARGNCTLENAAIRKEWGDLSLSERKDYTRAVLCLQSLPAKTTSYAPGARSRFDDYIVVHRNMTRQVHFSTSFTAWHRYYVWDYEQALRNECGYKGYQPYWNWGRYVDDLLGSPLFNGDEGSMGGNGAKVNYPDITIQQYNGTMTLPSGDGGGCVTTGPFANMTVNLGPTVDGSAVSHIEKNPQADGLGYNPRCLRRDIRPAAAARTTSQRIHDLIVNSDNKYWFDLGLDGELPNQSLGLHGGGHYTFGIDPGADFYMSPGDPMFWLHHAALDWVWWVWQTQDLERRLYTPGYAYSRTITMLNDPPSRNGTLDDVYGMGMLGRGMRQAEMMTTLGGLEGQACYLYV